MIHTRDTNVFIDAHWQPPELDRLKAFLSWAQPLTVLSSFVAAEQARENGWIIVTRDADFRALRPHVSGLKMIASFPERA